MVRQLGRVNSDLKDQVNHFRGRGSAKVIPIGIVALNHAPIYTSYEGEQVWTTTGVGRHLHPVQEAAKVRPRLCTEAGSHYFEFLVLDFLATNQPPHKFAWLNRSQTELEYAAALARVCQQYQERFPI